MTDLYLYVDNEDSTGSWSTTGSAPYLSTQNQPTDYISDTGRNTDSGVYSFPSSGKSTETINSVTLYIYAYGVSSSDFTTFVNSTDTQLGPPTSWGWVNVDVSSILTTWAQIDAATIYFDRPNTTNDAGVDCAYLLVDYTAGTDTSDSTTAWLKGSQDATSNTDAYLKGSQDTSDNQTAWLKGSQDASDSSEAYLKGSADTSDDIPAWLKGSASASDSTEAFLEGATAGSDPSVSWAALRIPPSFGGAASDSTPVYLKGRDTATDSQGAYTKGSDTANSQQGAYTSGQAVTTTSQVAFLVGQNTASSSVPAYMQGSDSASDNSPAYLKGSSSTSGTQEAYLKGSLSVSSDIPAYLQGQDSATDSTPAYLEGTSGETPVSDSTEAYLRGSQDASDSTEAYLSGSQDTSDSTGAYLEGISGASDSTTAYLQGQDTASDSTSAYLVGGVSISSSTSAYMDANVLVTSSTSAYMNGYAAGSVSDSIPAYTFGMGERLYPNGDIAQSGSWKREDDSTSNLYQSIDEYPGANDTDYVWYEEASGGEYFEVAMSDPTNPVIGDGDVTVFFRLKKRSGTKSVTLRMELKEGTTTIATDSKTLASTDTTYMYTLTSGEKASITDWTNLRVRFFVQAVF